MTLTLLIVRLSRVTAVSLRYLAEVLPGFSSGSGVILIPRNITSHRRIDPAVQAPEM